MVQPRPGPAAGVAQAGEGTSSDLLTQIAILQSRLATMPAIEQTKGVLMAVCGLTDDAAFDLLRWRSQHSNTKVRDLALRLTEALAAGDIGTPVTTTRMDRLLDVISEDDQQQTGRDR
jgi:AmiR/NasT family two-component response regulator